MHCSHTQLGGNLHHGLVVERLCERREAAEARELVHLEADQEAEKRQDAQHHGRRKPAAAASLRRSAWRTRMRRAMTLRQAVGSAVRVVVRLEAAVLAAAVHFF